MDVADGDRAAVAIGDRAVLARLSRLDRFLPLWIALAMAAGLGLGSLLPSLNNWLGKLQVGTVSLPIAASTLPMIVPCGTTFCMIAGLIPSCVKISFSQALVRVL